MLTEKDSNVFAETLQLLAKRFNGGRKLDDMDLKSYWFALADEFENIGEFQKAAKKVMKTWSYGRMPEPSAFIAAKKEHSDLDIEIIAQKAWDSVVYAIERGVGYTAVAEFEDELIPAVVELCGGFSELATKTYEELSWIKKEFIKTYKAALQGEISIKANEQRALLEDTKTLLITADYPTKTQNQKVLTYKEEQNRVTKLIANLANAKRITA